MANRNHEHHTSSTRNRAMENNRRWEQEAGEGGRRALRNDWDRSDQERNNIDRDMGRYTSERYASDGYPNDRFGGDMERGYDEENRPGERTQRFARPGQWPPLDQRNPRSQERLEHWSPANPNQGRFLRAGEPGGGTATPRRGRGPKGYTRSDERIREDVCDSIGRDHDASDVEVKVQSGEVTLTGTVPDRITKYHIEELADQVSGVKMLHNQISVKRSGERWEDANDSNIDESRKRPVRH